VLAESYDVTTAAIQINGKSRANGLVRQTRCDYITARENIYRFKKKKKKLYTYYNGNRTFEPLFRRTCQFPVNKTKFLYIYCIYLFFLLLFIENIHFCSTQYVILCTLF